MAQPITLGPLLKRLRKAAGLTQERLAERAGCSVVYLGLLENDHRVPHETMLSALATALDLAPPERAALADALRSARRPAAPSSERPASRSPASLPLLPTRLIGREREAAAAVALLGQAGGRLLTLIGPGGVGKSLLALRVAHEVAAGYADGVYVVSLADLADLADPTLVAATVAAAVGAPRERGRPILASLRAYLAPRHVLLLLDSVERLAGAATTVSSLLASCPRLDILATSRSPLRLHEERTLSVPPLAYPDPARLPDEDTIAGYPAVALFVERARATRPDIAPTGASLPAIARICARLDGLPLALELAAARVKALPLGRIEARLDEDRFALLTGGARDLPPRHRTMRDALAWSYNLLDEAERTLFRRLAVFPGDFTREGASAVCLDDGDNPADALDLLMSLLDKSLLTPTDEDTAREGGDEEPRFAMLETVRAYARERLEASGEAEAPRARHAAYVLAAAETVEHALRGVGQADGRRVREDMSDGPWAASRQASAGSCEAVDAAEAALRTAAALARVRHVLGDERFAAAWRAGQAAPLRQVVAAALRNDRRQRSSAARAQMAPTWEGAACID